MRYNAQTHYSDITVFAECPSCHKLIKMKSFTDAVLEGSRNCPFCRVFIGKKEIIASCQSYLRVTKAIQSGEIFDTYKIISVIFALIFIEAAFISFGGGKFNFLIYLMVSVSTLMLLGGFLNVRKWLSDYSRLQTFDKDFVEVKKKMRHAQIVWTWANILNFIWIFVFIKFL